MLEQELVCREDTETRQKYAVPQAKSSGLLTLGGSAKDTEHEVWIAKCKPSRMHEIMVGGCTPSARGGKHDNARNNDVPNI